MKENQTPTGLGTSIGDAKRIDNQAYSDAGVDEAKEAMKKNEIAHEKFDIKNSPFKALRIGKEWYLLMGKYRLNEKPLKSLTAVSKEAKDVSWDRLMQIMRIVAEDVLTAKIEEAKQEWVKKQTKEN